MKTKAQAKNALILNLYVKNVKVTVITKNTITAILYVWKNFLKFASNFTGSLILINCEYSLLLHLL